MSIARRAGAVASLCVTGQGFWQGDGLSGKGKAVAGSLYGNGDPFMLLDRRHGAIELEVHSLGSGATTRQLGQKAAIGVLGSPPLAVWRSAHTGQRCLDTSKILGSLPSLFAHRRATNKERACTLKVGDTQPRHKRAQAEH